ncbi:unnamed protein product [Lota lota]
MPKATLGCYPASSPCCPAATFPMSWTWGLCKGLVGGCLSVSLCFICEGIMAVTGLRHQPRLSSPGGRRSRSS